MPRPAPRGPNRNRPDIAPALATRLAQAGSRWDDRTGAVSMPVYHATTYRHPELGRSTGYDYSRTANPTRSVLEAALADIEGGARAAAFASGLSALHAVASLFRPGDAILVNRDPYGGTYRAFEGVWRPLGIEAVWTDTTSPAAVRRAWTPRVRAILAETPSNPLLRISPIRALADLAHGRGARLIVDNTFMTPVAQRPLELGADLALYSATKYLGGHNDVLAGAVVSRSAEDGERLAWIQNAIGAVPGPQDAWLLLRGLKTLTVRMERQQAQARRIAAWLARDSRVRRVWYPGLAGHPGRARHAAQASGPGAMIAFETDRRSRATAALRRVRVFLFAESLGGVESLITYPVSQTHADIPARLRADLGIHDTLLRLSVGLEDPDDLIADLDQALGAPARKNTTPRKGTAS